MLESNMITIYGTDWKKTGRGTVTRNIFMGGLIVVLIEYNIYIVNMWLFYSQNRKKECKTARLPSQGVFSVILKDGAGKSPFLTQSESSFKLYGVFSRIMRVIA